MYKENIKSETSTQTTESDSGDFLTALQGV